jgi:hypothetical protein
MDDIVRSAMAKWPDVPAVFGWLALDRRGQWRIKGESAGNPVLNAFINRNYTHDEHGRWFFQNGPQRVFVELAYTPFVYRLPASAEAAVLQAHSGASAHEIRAAYVDETGTIIIDTELGPGTIDDRDLNEIPAHLTSACGATLEDDALLAALAAPESCGLRLRHGPTLVPVQAMRSGEIEARLGFVRKPLAPPDAEPCC